MSAAAAAPDLLALARRTIESEDFWRAPLFDAVKAVRTGAELTGAVDQAVAVYTRDSGWFATDAWRDLVAASLVTAPRGANRSKAEIEGHPTYRAYRTAFRDALLEIVEGAGSAASPTRGDFRVAFTQTGCDVTTAGGHRIVSCEKGEGQMTVTSVSLAAEHGCALLIGRSYVNGRSLMEDVASAFSAYPRVWRAFLKNPVAKPAFSPGEGRIYLCVPISDRTQAKAAGARWDPDERAWYAARADAPEPTARWRPHFDLRPDPLPETCWLSNVRSHVSNGDWERIKKLTFVASGYRCQSCGGRGEKWPVECHEVWAFDDKARTQTLRGMTALCPACHEVVHFGLANVRGRASEAMAHLKAVTGLSHNACADRVKNAFERCLKRGRVQWKLKLDYLDALGVQCQRAPAHA